VPDARARARVTSPTATKLRRELRQHANADDAKTLARFFQTKPGQYAEGDKFLGVRVPAVRSVARANREASLDAALALLSSRWHEERLLALLLMVQRYQRGTIDERRAVFDAYLAHLEYVNNWDLVDSSAEHIVGPQVSADDLSLLERMAASHHLWTRRVAMLATFHHIKLREFRPALHIALRLLNDTHHLMHKAVGWMLREIGKRDRTTLVAFLDAHWTNMPRTAVRYAIEHFTPAARRRYMS
jgi:3-methyladenine DNA glycosylase AlkD